MSESTENKGAGDSEKELQNAQTLDQDIRASLRVVQGGTVHLFNLVAKAKETPNFLELVLDENGKPFKDWSPDVVDVMSREPQLHASIREGFVQVLTDEGLSLREVGKAMKISKSQVAKDLAKVGRAFAAEAKSEAGTPGTPKPRTKTAGERLYDQVSAAVTQETVTDVKKFSEADLKRLERELDRAYQLVQKQYHAITVDAKVKQLMSETEAKVRAEVEASLAAGVVTDEAPQRNRQGNQSRRCPRECLARDGLRPDPIWPQSIARSFYGDGLRESS